MRSKSITLVLALIASLFAVPAASATDLKSGGSTFSANFVEQCRTRFAKETGLILNYTPNGSGAGRNFFTQKITDFAISDTPFSSNDVKPNEPFLYVPIVSGPIAVVYKLDGYAGRIKLSKEALAKIFAGQIKMWNDPQIAKINPGKLPKTKIIVLYRSDGSGTSEVFTSYLNSVAPSVWTKPGSKTFASAFPGDMNDHFGYFQSANGSTLIATTQANLNGSISYNEVSYVRNLKSALIENETGRFMGPTQSATSSFLSNVKFDNNGVSPLNFKNPSKYSYNIVTFAYAISYEKPSKNGALIKKFLNFALDRCNNIEGYAPIKGSALKVAKSQISKISN